jgi:hypothetical protein
MIKLPFILLFITIGILLLLIVFTRSEVNTNFKRYWINGNNWKLKKNRNGVKVYISNCYNSGIKKFAATINLTTDLNELVDIIYNFENYPKWIQGCKSARLIKENDKNSKTGYIEISVLWPFNNRDMILNFQVSAKTEKLFKAVIISKSDEIPVKSGVIKLQNITGSFMLKELSQYDIEVSCQLFIEPKGNIPDWIVNMFIVKMLYKSLYNIEKISIKKQTIELI